ncbi:hypothetical protein C5167_019717 [Papaver somniferum]|uniref:Uncharacterized protein n=1 Tax=Papaver somniferum TaxID=3469 RepID=A0A4Y7IU24_PAPSO|nr:uncharacterized protein LOC113349138 [Papaver somniferum]RZC51290.1 hypothetical protein C5167_019717 [Papaver somniferum]
MEIQTSDVEDFSASATLIYFKSPVPPLRIPIPAGLSDDPSQGPFVLAFKDSLSWKSALQASESKIIEQCEAGARIGCSINASSKCRPPWWKTLLGGAPMDLAEREQCEECEMSACLVASKESCLKFAKDKCLSPFLEARIALTDQKGIVKLPNSATGNLEVTNCRGSDI